MKWYWVLIIIIIIALAWYGYTLVKKANEYKASTSLGKTPEEIVNNLIKTYGLDGNKIKQEAAKYNVIVLGEEETHTMEYNPRRVILKRVQLNCFAAPCPEILTIKSIG